MKSRFLPYATTPARLTAQLLGDLLIAAWITAWVLVGMAVHHAIATFAEVGTQVRSGATGLSDNLNSAGDNADRLPLVGDAVAKPLRAASAAALDLAGAGASLNSTATWLSVLLAVAVAAPPILAVGMPWLALRIRFFRRKWTVIALAQTPAGEQLLALRALANRPLRRLTDVSPDPVGARRREEPQAVHGLAALGLRSAGVARVTSAR
jgi:hypothetical protein